MPRFKDLSSSQGDSKGGNSSQKGPPPWLKPKPAEPSTDTTTQTPVELSSSSEKKSADQLRQLQQNQDALKKAKQEAKAIEDAKEDAKYARMAQQLRDIRGGTGPLEYTREMRDIDDIIHEYNRGG